MSDEQDDKSDLTRIEDLAEFLHEEDAEVDAQLDTGPHKKEIPSEAATNIDELDDDATSEELNFSEDEDEDDDHHNHDSFLEEEGLPFEDDQDGTQENDSDNSFFYEDEEQSKEDFSEENSNFEQQFNDEFTSEEDDEQDAIQDILDPTVVTDDDAHNSEIDTLPQFAPPSPTTQPRAPETFKDVQTFAQNITYGKITVGGNPPFSIILKNIKFLEDAEDIISILQEHSLIQDGDVEMFRQSMERGSAIIPQIGEFAAITLVHKLRRFELDILMGLAEEVHPSKSYSAEEYRGLISKENLFQNKEGEIELAKQNLKEEEIILTTLPSLEGLVIREYLGIITDHKIIDLEEASTRFQIEQLDEDQFIDSENLKPDDEDQYRDLLQGLRPKAYALEANAVVDIKFSLTPLLSKDQSETLYKLTCTGNAVFITD